MERLRDEQTQKFLGTASVRLEVLDFSLTHDTRLPGSEPDWDNVESLGGLFLSGISFAPHQISHQIPALIDQTQFNEALNNANVSSERLKRNDVEIVELNFAAGSRVHCLRGQDRVLAAMRVAEDMNRRWVIRLYQQDLSLEAIKDLKDERSSEKEPSDAELLYWTTRFWLEHEDSLDDHQNKWLAHLARKSKSKATGLQRLWKNHVKYKNLIREFEKTPALFGGAQLGNISRWISAPDKMNVNQMKRVLDFWRDICDSNDSIKSRLSTRMLEEVGGKTPGSSKKHHDDIRDMANKILRNFENNERQDILNRLEYATRDRLVPTFSIFIKNIGYLKEVVGCLRHLVSGTLQNIRKNLDGAFSKRNPCMLQVADNRCKWVEAGEINQKELAYRQLWLFALREHPSISKQIERKKAAPKYFIDESKLYQFALLAQKLGYCTPQITAIVNQPRMIVLSTGEKSFSKTSGDSSNYSDGKPLSKDQEEHKHSLFLENIHKPFNPECPGSRFFFSQRSLYLDVFGDEFKGIENFLNAAALCDEQSLGDEAMQVDKWQEATTRKDIQELSDMKTKLEEEVQQLRKSVTSEGEDAQSMRSQFWEMANKVKEKEESLEDINKNIEAKKKEEAELFEKINKEIEKLESVQSRLREDEQREQDGAGRLRTQEEKERDLESRAKSLKEEIDTLVCIQNRSSFVPIGEPDPLQNTEKCNTETILQLQKDKEELEKKMNALKEGIDAPRQEDQHTETTCVECQHGSAFHQPPSSTLLEIQLNFQESTEIVKVGKRVLRACMETFAAQGYNLRDERGGFLTADTCFDLLSKLPPEERAIRLIHRNKRKYALLEQDEIFEFGKEATPSQKKKKPIPYEELTAEELTAKELLEMHNEKRESTQSKLSRGPKGISTIRKHS
ncbi:hypothetical protein FOTG_15236 [Fusarium oxysporum f. sp. vasinfectum 25433]|uniref:Uncharacterized protein n=1 Tax=Fusarium oxysporum f. sp. vasinfectum 25433 TaxID=1089449 RepID=X0M763_FUSOX|nr:hypothetical protein FOTG_15236 [Fusarium oxysporum f. sp. vasinfectum 25433]